MKVVIFENEYESVKGAFQAANLLCFNGSLKFDQFSSAQNANVERIDQYDVIFIDISLAAKSDMDGFTLIQKIKTINEKLLSRVVILTGNNKIEEGLRQRNLEVKSVRIIIKPTDYEEIANHIMQITAQL